jgi:hypothetical protein
MGIAFFKGNAIPAAVSMGVVIPTVIVHSRNERVYIVIPLIPEFDRLSRRDVSGCFREDGEICMALLGDGIMTSAVHIKAAVISVRRRVVSGDVVVSVSIFLQYRLFLLSKIGLRGSAKGTSGC